jgi:predicted enzyme related to lactoylglutathione lyase
MRRVTGIGGIFFKVKDLAKSREWYQKHLGINSGEYGKIFTCDEGGMTVWNPFPADTDYFNPGDKPFMINYRVENLEELLKVLKEEGVEIVGDMQSYDYGKFGWIMDPDGHKIELWEPPATPPEGF